MKEKYVIIEDEIQEIRKLSEKKSQSGMFSEKDSKEIKEFRTAINKLKKEKQDMQSNFDDSYGEIRKLKQMNAEVTKEAISMNEEKLHLKVT